MMERNLIPFGFPYRSFRLKSRFLFLALIVALTSPVLAQNLVTNGGGETGDFTGWTQFGDTSFSGVCADGSPSVDCSGYAPHTGPFMGSFGL